MQQSLTQTELLELQNTSPGPNKQKSNSNTELIEREKYPNTGFEIIGNQEKGYFVALGPYRLTEFKANKDLCKALIKTRDYDLLFGMIGAAIKADERIQAIQEQIDALQKALDEHQ